MMHGKTASGHFFKFFFSKCPPLEYFIKEAVFLKARVFIVKMYLQIIKKRTIIQEGKRVTYQEIYK